MRARHRGPRLWRAVHGHVPEMRFDRLPVHVHTRLSKSDSDAVIEGADCPIEPGIAPLVLELRRTGFFVPTWSCEGYLDHDGKLWKVPRVWFTCETPLHL